jgi:hypothetical protein
VPKALTAVLFIFWVAMAYRQFQRGDLLLATVFLAVGVALTAYRLRRSTPASLPPGDQKR